MEATEFGAFSKPSFPLGQTFSASQAFSRFNAFTFLSGYFQKIMSQQKPKASHPRKKQYFCSRPKQKFLAVSQPESDNASSRDCKNYFDSVVQEAQHSSVRISNVSSVSANTQSYASNNQAFQSWIMLKGFDESPQMNVLLCILNDMFAMLKTSSSYHRPRKEWS